MTRILGVGLALGLGAVSLGWSGCSHLSRGTCLDGERSEFIKDGVTPWAQIIYSMGSVFDN